MARSDSAPATAPRRPPRGPHVLVASTGWRHRGGSDVQRALLARQTAWLARGGRHMLLAPGVRGAGMLDCGGWPWPGPQGWRVALDRSRAARLIERAEPEIIESADPFTLAWAVLDAARALQAPTVAFCHRHWPALAAEWMTDRHVRLGAARWANRHLRRYLAQVYGGYDLVLAPSRHLTEALQSLGVRHARHQPLGVSVAVFNPAAADARWRRTLLSQLGLAPSTRLVVYAGLFTRENDLDLLAQAVDLLGPGHALLAVGQGPRPPRGPRVFTLGPMRNDADWARLLASGDVFAHAGEHEAYGHCALQAMACGTPVVTSRAAGMGEIVEGVGLTLHSRRPSDWADALHSALHGRDIEAHRHGIALGLERARSLDWPIVIDALSRRYRRLLERGSLDADSTLFTHTRRLPDERRWTAV